MKKKELIDEIASEAEITKKQAGKALDAALKVITKHLKEGESVTLPGFGTFSVRARPTRVGRNSRTGELMSTKASRATAFRPGARLKTAIGETDDPGPSRPARTTVAKKRKK